MVKIITNAVRVPHLSMRRSLFEKHIDPASYYLYSKAFGFAHRERKIISNHLLEETND